MTNYSRKNAKIFGETANPIGTDQDIGPEIGQFGSAKAGTYNGTNDIDVIQSLPAWSNGWVDAVTPSQQFPTLPERTAVDYVQSYQNAYLLQKGVAEWDSATVYYTTSYCQHNGALYRSKINDNAGNEPIANTSNDYWQFLGKDFLNTQQVTNCLLEVPNNIKLELENGVLTLKAGSKVIVPNGFEQDGVTPKFDEVTIESDIVVYYETVTNGLMLSYNTTTGGYICTQNIQCYSGTTAPSPASGTIRQTWYDTTNNIIKTRAGSGAWTEPMSFPIAIINCIATNTFTINQIFNGIGYVGAITWADKGIKGLIPNGRNADGTLKNDEFITEKIMTYAVDASLGLAGYRYICLSADVLNSVNPMNAFYDATKNTFQLSGGSHVAKIGTILTDNNGKIISQSLDGALNINSMCDGGWVDSDLTIANNVNLPSSGTSLEYDLSSYLPIDSNNYEVILTGDVITGTTSGNIASLRVSSKILNTYQIITTVQTRSSSSTRGGGTLILPIGADRKLYVTPYDGQVGTFRLNARGYKRLGTNA